MKTRKAATLDSVQGGFALVVTLAMMGKPGERIVSKPVAYADKSQKIVPCYDRYLPVNPDVREFPLLFPDPNTGLRVYSLFESGPYD
jgi:hypothetical protein